jgi:hypothetical protein
MLQEINRHRMKETIAAAKVAARDETGPITSGYFYKCTLRDRWNFDRDGSFASS